MGNYFGCCRQVLLLCGNISLDYFKVCVFSQCFPLVSGQDISTFLCILLRVYSVRGHASLILSNVF